MNGYTKILLLVVVVMILVVVGCTPANVTMINVTFITNNTLPDKLYYTSSTYGVYENCTKIQ